MQFLGLQVVGIPNRGRSTTRESKFCSMFGSSSKDLSDIWNNLGASTDSNNMLEPRKQGENGIVAYLKAVHFLWAYPKNAVILGTMFGNCKRGSHGLPVWLWIQRIAALKDKKIKWLDVLDNPNTAVFIANVDRTDFCTWEPKHPTMPVSQKLCSHKFKHAGLRYGIALSVFTGKCVWVSDPYPAGVHDMEIFRQGMKAKIKDGKLVIADCRYRTKDKDKEKMLSLPNPLDDKQTNNFKSRAQQQQEYFNKKLKEFSILNKTYHHNLDKHKFVLQAVCVMVQTRLDNGELLFEP